MKVFYCGLEKINSRYTLQLEEWNKVKFEKYSIPFIPIYGSMPEQLSGKISTGSVLDAHGRTHYSLTQMANLVSLLHKGEISNQDVIFFEDMFTPGIESLPYIFAQMDPNSVPSVYVRCLAQTIDPDDFTNRCGMFSFMRPYEQMVASFIKGLLVASEEMVAFLRIAGFQDVPIYVTGLPFGKDNVRSFIGNIVPLKDRPYKVAYAARWDDEKQPLFFLDVAAKIKSSYSNVEFVVLTGNDTLISNNPSLLDAARRAVNEGLITIHEGLSKKSYYEHLASSRVLFNCALQDWVSNTVSEADSLGTQTLFPAYRSFPEVFNNDRLHMYLPWSIEDAVSKLEHLVLFCPQKTGKVSEYQDKSVDRTIEIFLSKNARLNYGRNNLAYRRKVNML